MEFLDPVFETGILSALVPKHLPGIHLSAAPNSSKEVLFARTDTQSSLADFG